MNLSMAGQAQSNPEVSIKETVLGALPLHEFSPEFFKGEFVVMGVKANGFAVAGSCLALLASVIIALENGGSPSHVRFGFSQYFLLASLAVLPVVSFKANALLSLLGLELPRFKAFRVVKGQEFGNSHLGVHPESNSDRTTATTMAKMLALVFGNPLIDSAIVRLRVVSGIWKSFRPSFHENSIVSSSIENSKANGVNCWKPERREPRAISSQASGTPLEGSETTGAV